MYTGTSYQKRGLKQSRHENSTTVLPTISPIKYHVLEFICETYFVGFFTPMSLREQWSTTQHGQ